VAAVALIVGVVVAVQNAGPDVLAADEARRTATDILEPLLGWHLTGEYPGSIRYQFATAAGITTVRAERVVDRSWNGGSTTWWEVRLSPATVAQICAALPYVRGATALPPNAINDGDAPTWWPAGNLPGYAGYELGASGPTLYIAADRDVVWLRRNLQ
jgi:hypothetical protein